MPMRVSPTRNGRPSVRSAGPAKAGVPSGSASMSPAKPSSARSASIERRPRPQRRSDQRIVEQRLHVAVVEAHGRGMLDERAQPAEEHEVALARQLAKEERHLHQRRRAPGVGVRDQRRQLIGVDRQRIEAHGPPYRCPVSNGQSAATGLAHVRRSRSLTAAPLSMRSRRGWPARRRRALARPGRPRASGRRGRRPPASRRRRRRRCARTQTSRASPQTNSRAMPRARKNAPSPVEVPSFSANAL